MQTLAVISHDAGGAEVLSSWVRQHPEYHYCFHLKGPAESIFLKKLPSYQNSGNLESLYCCNKIHKTLTGTSWASDLEKDAVRVAKKMGIKSISFLDHWTNYPQRFESQGKTVLPDEIWVGDEYALELAKTLFPKELLKLVPNPYFQDLEEELSKASVISTKPENPHILYVCEPIQEHSLKQFGTPLHWGYTEFDAMKLFFTYAKGKELKKIRIRLHPSEKFCKYDEILSEFPELPLEKSRGSSLIEDCMWSNSVVGCESMALVVALLAKKKVFSCIPPQGSPCSLPQSEIIHLFQRRNNAIKVESLF